MLVRQRKIDDTVSGGCGVAKSSSLFTYVSHFSFPSVTCLHASAVLQEECQLCRIFPLFSLPPFSPSSSRRVPCCFSCIVRLQVVWEQDLREHMRAGETPWLTWLWDEERERKRRRRRLTLYGLSCSCFPILFCSKYIHTTHYKYVVAYWSWFDIVRRRTLNYQDVWNNVLSLDVKIEKLQQSRGQRHKTHHSREEVQFHQSCCVTEAAEQLWSSSSIKYNKSLIHEDLVYTYTQGLGFEAPHHILLIQRYQPPKNDL